MSKYKKNKYEHLSKKAKEERKKWKMCERKVKYDTEEMAGKDSKVYRCPYCKGWHRSTHLKDKIKQIASKRKYQ